MVQNLYVMHEIKIYYNVLAAIHGYEPSESKHSPSIDTVPSAPAPKAQSNFTLAIDQVLLCCLTETSDFTKR